VVKEAQNLGIETKGVGEKWGLSQKSQRKVEKNPKKLPRKNKFVHQRRKGERGGHRGGGRNKGISNLVGSTIGKWGKMARRTVLGGSMAGKKKGERGKTQSPSSGALAEMPGEIPGGKERTWKNGGGGGSKKVGPIRPGRAGEG